ncbi:MAG: WbqC family protein [Campylobacter sp.]|nr:WbqC family protein [Campylobacter sp.]MBR6611706.1 WbqC family protein [Campylobacter sp.]
MQNKKVAILQSNYIPWKGYFDIIDSVDEFIFYDEMQYTTRDWRNRNKIKTQNGLNWLTIACENKGAVLNFQKISETKIVDKTWYKKHWNAISNAYSKAPYFKKYRDFFANLYSECASEVYLCNVNYKFILAINELLGIETKITYDKDYGLIDGKTERLVDLVKKANGAHYLSGPAAKDYIDEKLFEEAGITLEWMDYSGYKEYPQFYPPFEHGVSVLDLIFNTGKEAIDYIRNKDCV